MNYPVKSNDASITAYTNNYIQVNISSKENNKLTLITTPGEEGLYVM